MDEFSDDVKAEAISRCSGGRDFAMVNGDVALVIFSEATYERPSPSRILAMCEVVQKEFDLLKKHAPPPKPTIEQQLEYLWKDIRDGKLNTTGEFYTLLYPHLHK